MLSFDASSRGRLERVVASSALLLLLAGCDSLNARFRAREGVDLFHQSDFKGAAEKFDEASRLDPNLPVLLLNAGTSNLAHYRAVGGKVAEGQAAASKTVVSYERYLALKPDDSRVKAALVQTFVETGRYEDAVVFFRPAVEKRPADIEALGTLATIAAKCGKVEDAEMWHQRRIEAAPDKSEGYLSLGIFLWQGLHDHPGLPHEQRAQKAELAIRALKKAIDLQPAAPNGYTYVNLVYRELAASEPTEEGKRKNLEEAARYFKMASERQKAG